MKLRSSLLAALCLAALAIIGTIMNGQAAAEGGPQVTVVNTPANPVPISGNTVVSGTVAATQSGPWTVGGSINVNNLPTTQAVSISSDTSGLTHVRRPASDLVTLLGPDENHVGFFHRWLPNLTFEVASPTGYTPPFGKVLVVTDFLWTFTAPANSNLSATLEVADPTLASHAVVVYSTAQADAAGRLGTSVHLTTGFVVKAGNILRAPVPVNASVQGYLVDDK